MFLNLSIIAYYIYIQEQIISHIKNAFLLIIYKKEYDLKGKIKLINIQY